MRDCTTSLHIVAVFFILDLLVEGLSADFLLQKLLLLVTLNDFCHSFFVIEALHLAIPFTLLGILDFHERGVLFSQVGILRVQSNRLLETFLGAIEVIFRLEGESHPIVSLGILRVELERIPTRLDTVLVAISLQLTQRRVRVKNIKNLVALGFLLVI